MRVLHVIPSVSAVHGGPSFALPLMLRALRRAGVSADVATTDDDGPGARLDVPLETPVERDDARYFFFRKQTEFYKVSFGLRSWLRQNVATYDLVHIHALFSHTSVAAGRSARAKKIPYIVRPLGVLNRWGMMSRRRRLKKLSFHFIERPLLRSAAGLHFTTEQERTETEMLGLHCRSFVVPLGVDAEAFQKPRHASRFLDRWPELGSREILLFLSRIDRTKGLSLLLEALAEVVRRRPNVALLIAGAGDRRFVEELRAKVEELRLENHVVWAGYLTGDAKLDALSAARVFVLPSHSESFGIAVVEALAAGVPTIVSEGVGIARELAEAQAALVVPPQTQPVADGIVRILEDEELARGLSMRGAALVRERYSIEGMGQKLVAMYEECLGR